VGIGTPPRPVKIRKPADAVALGLALVPEDRKKRGLLLLQSIRVNSTLASQPSHQTAGFLDPSPELASTEKLRERRAVRCNSAELPVATWSGGNQQKVVIGRWLLCDSEVLLLGEPTRGVDVPTKEAIYALLRALAGEGKAIGVVSGELSELMSLCDRIAVMSVGRIVEEFLPAEWTAQNLTEPQFRGHLASFATV
jgi:ribose transport system ATP-binding protein